MPADIITIKKYQGTHKRKQHCFLQAFVGNIAERSREYTRLYLKKEDFLANGLLTGERGSYSLMAAAMDRITPMHESEMSVSRRRVGRLIPENQDCSEEQAGRVDLWSCFDGLEYFMEFKRNYISADIIHACDVTREVSKSWESLDSQVDEIKRGVARNPDYKGYENRTYFIGMHTITPYRTNKDKRKIIDSLENDQFKKRTLKRWVQKLSPRPDVAFVWKITKQKHKFGQISWDDDGAPKWGAYPCHLFCFRIMRNHEGE